jgi:hypothetical protein
MTINPYFDFYNNSAEQNLYEDLFIEALRMYGFNTYYMPAHLDDFDEVFRESPSRTFNQAIVVEAYLKANLKFGGDGKFASQELGLEIRDSTILTVAQKTFGELTSMERPREGDLIFLPLDKKVYEIKFVEHQDIFYQLGKLVSWDLHCELLEYNGERFNTGIADIDIIATKYDIDGAEDNTVKDWTEQSSEIQGIANNYIDWSEKDPFGNGGTL